MSESMRGTRLGAVSYETEDRVEFAERPRDAFLGEIGARLHRLDQRLDGLGVAQSAERIGRGPRDEHVLVAEKGMKRGGDGRLFPLAEDAGGLGAHRSAFMFQQREQCVTPGIGVNGQHSIGGGAAHEWIVIASELPGQRGGLFDAQRAERLAHMPAQDGVGTVEERQQFGGAIGGVGLGDGVDGELLLENVGTAQIGDR